MNPAIRNLEPAAVWEHFDNITALSRPSGGEREIHRYVAGKAKDLGLNYQVDAAGNLLVLKPAYPGRESAPATALQAHLDMVCVKNEDSPHDFSKDPIQTEIRDGWVHAKGTTLGADNGIGVAAALAVMESTDLKHGPLEFIFTVDEETGLTGAMGLQPGVLNASYLLNLDSEEAGTVIIGSAGGVRTAARRMVSRQSPKMSAAFRLHVNGLKGGHSGLEIDRGRGNALRIMGGLLQQLLDMGAELVSVAGGGADNTIPKEASAAIRFDEKRKEELLSLVRGYEDEIKAALGSFDPGVRIDVEKIADGPAPQKVLYWGGARRMADLLAAMPHGVLAMSPDIAGLVQTSTNLANISITGHEVEIVSSQRSSIGSSSKAAADMVATVCRLAGFEVEHSNKFPAWKPDPGSALLRKLQSAHTELLGNPLEVSAIHAGLECGIIREKYPAMQMASLGPTIRGAHTPDEKVEIATVLQFYKHLCKVLELL